MAPGMKQLFHSGPEISAPSATTIRTSSSPPPADDLVGAPRYGQKLFRHIAPLETQKEVSTLLKALRGALSADEAKETPMLEREADIVGETEKVAYRTIRDYILSKLRKGSGNSGYPIKEYAVKKLEVLEKDFPSYEYLRLCDLVRRNLDLPLREGFHFIKLPDLPVPESQGSNGGPASPSASTHNARSETSLSSVSSPGSVDGEHLLPTVPRGFPNFGRLRSTTASPNRDSMVGTGLLESAVESFAPPPVPTLPLSYNPYNPVTPEPVSTKELPYVPIIKPSRPAPKPPARPSRPIPGAPGVGGPSLSPINTRGPSPGPSRSKKQQEYIDLSEEHDQLPPHTPSTSSIPPRAVHPFANVQPLAHSQSSNSLASPDEARRSPLQGATHIFGTRTPSPQPPLQHGHNLLPGLAPPRTASPNGSGHGGSSPTGSPSRSPGKITMKAGPSSWRLPASPNSSTTPRFPSPGPAEDSGSGSATASGSGSSPSYLNYPTASSSSAAYAELAPRSRSPGGLSIQQETTPRLQPHQPVSPLVIGPPRSPLPPIPSEEEEDLRLTPKTMSRPLSGILGDSRYRGAVLSDQWNYNSNGRQGNLTPSPNNSPGLSPFMSGQATPPDSFPLSPSPVGLGINGWEADVAITKRLSKLSEGDEEDEEEEEEEEQGRQGRSRSRSRGRDDRDREEDEESDAFHFDQQGLREEEIEIEPLQPVLELDEGKRSTTHSHASTSSSTGRHSHFANDSQHSITTPSMSSCGSSIYQRSQMSLLSEHGGTDDERLGGGGRVLAPPMEDDETVLAHEENARVSGGKEDAANKLSDEEERLFQELLRRRGQVLRAMS